MSSPLSVTTSFISIASSVSLAHGELLRFRRNGRGLGLEEHGICPLKRPILNGLLHLTIILRISRNAVISLFQVVVLNFYCLVWQFVDERSGCLSSSQTSLFVTFCAVTLCAFILGSVLSRKWVSRHRWMLRVHQSKIIFRKALYLLSINFLLHFSLLTP